MTADKKLQRDRKRLIRTVEAACEKGGLFYHPDYVSQAAYETLCASPYAPLAEQAATTIRNLERRTLTLDWKEFSDTAAQLLNQILEPLGVTLMCVPEGDEYHLRADQLDTVERAGREQESWKRVVKSTDAAIDSIGA